MMRLAGFALRLVTVVWLAVHAPMWLVVVWSMYVLLLLVTGEERTVERHTHDSD